MAFWIDPLAGWRSALWAIFWWGLAAAVTLLLFPITQHRFVYFTAAVAVIAVRSGSVWGILAVLGTIPFSVFALLPHPSNFWFSAGASGFTGLVIIVLSHLLRRSLTQSRAQAIERKQAQQATWELLETEKQLRAELEEASRAKDEFLATLSHELRTPLTAIMGWGQILRMGKLAPDETRQAAEIIDRNARIQVQLIDDLLDMSRITNGKMLLEIREVNLNEIVSSALETVLPAADAKGLQLYRTLESTPSLIRGDSSRLQQCLTNLLNNAVKFTPAGGRVDVTVESRSDEVEVVVRDTGIGMSSDFVSKAFDRFRQSDATTTRRHGGLGLGLAIVKSLVEMHGGKVDARSQGDGKGSTFLLRFPRVAPAPVFSESKDSEACRGSRSDLSGLKLLVVEDDRDAREWLVKVLEGAGVAVNSAASGEEALRQLEAHSFEMMISDIAMPGMDGLELIRRVRALAGFESDHFRAVALSAYGRAEDRQRARQAGFDQVLTKPVEITELLTTLAQSKV